MYVKICGIRDAVTARHCVDAGADAIGLVMSPKSSRHVEAAQAAEVVAAVLAASAEVDVVLVTNSLPAVDAARTAHDLGVDVLQLHGRAYSADDFAAAREVMPRLWRATSLAHHPDVVPGQFDEERLLVDGSDPGSGRTWQLDPADATRLGDQWILAGGLTPDNVADAVSATALWGVDVSSGVESASGVKSTDLITRFITAARS